MASGFYLLRLFGFLGLFALPGSACFCLRFVHHTQQRSEFLLHLPAVDDEVYKPMLHQEFSTLEPFWQVFAYCFFNNTRPCEPDERARLCNIEITQHGE